MIAWWEAMTLVEQIFAVVGIAATVLLVIEVILLLVGVGHGADAGTDAPGDVHTDMGGIHDGLHDAIPHTDVHIGEITTDGATDIDISMDTDAPPGDHPDSGQAHFEGSGLHLFTLQGLVAFFAVFGWSGLLLLKSDVLPVASVILAIVFGLVAMVLMAVAMRGMLKLQSDGTMDIRNALGKSGTVYLPIHEKRSAAGKVTVMVQGTLTEMDAVTDEDATIPTGAQVVVTGITSGNTLVVKRK
ncbi:MAG: NfeD family protein [Christensenella sp.]|uniref:NfeD family protein n=1 Tax=Christensenella sp. TaxID=1935934 RepID=UPI002B1FA5B1|nr:NfeD family protein [Christensenella sp.]MEA5004612.1 NfeD family protein [Christensenella sp.]